MTGWAIEALIASTLLMLVVLALRGPVATRFGAHAAYLLWLLPALRMVLPRMPEFTQPLPAVPLHLDVGRLVAAGTADSGATSSALPAAMNQPAFDWLTIALVVWLGGAAIYLAWHLGRHRRFMSVALSQSRPGFRHGRIQVYLSPVVSGPLAAGILHRHILLPSDFERRYNSAEQQLVLAHELAHHRRGDLIANSAALVMLALHWFNPVAHLAYRAFRADQELACDATVLEAAPAARSDYGRALIKSARAGMPAAACALGPATQLKRRIQMIAHSTGSRACRMTGVGLAVVVVGLGLGLTASGSIAAPSQVAPARAKPLLHPQVQPRPQAGAFPIAGGSIGLIESADRDRAGFPAAPLAPTPPAPLAPMAPVPPVPPAPPLPAPVLAADHLRQISEISSMAEEIGRQAAADIDVRGIQREALAQVRAELARECRHARRGRADETDNEAIGRLAGGCVDMAEIDREVREALREAIHEIRNARDLSEADRARALAAVERARSEAAHRINP